MSTCYVHAKPHLKHCWDAKIDSIYGWVECVGLANRSASDLRGRLHNLRLTNYRLWQDLVEQCP